MYVKREGDKIVGAVRWPAPGFDEEIATDHADYVAFLVEQSEPQEPQLTAEDLYDMLKGKGVVADNDRPAGKPRKKV